MTFSIVKWFCFFPLLIAFAQNPSAVHVESFPIQESRDSVSFSLSKPFIVPASIRVRIDSTATRNMLFHRPTNTVTVFFDSSVQQKSRLYISYTFVPIKLQPSYSLRTLTYQNDSLGKKKKHTVVTRTEGVFSNIFGPELSKSGSINRGFLVGSNRDLTLSSGFRLQMAGKLSDDIDIVAALTDENTPIQPQGNTQSLQEIDNVFVEIKSPSYTATLGDFQFSAQSGEFVHVNRKLQGAKILADHQFFTPRTKVQLTGATSRGKFTTNQFQGVEGVQGPYRLSGKNNERAIIIIAGSEKVYVDGTVMVRGENNDYTIEYGSAEVIFTTRRLITGNSRIVVDFEYSDRQYTRNFVGVDGDTKLTSDITVRVNYFREGDDPDAPIDITLTDSDKALLQQAGNTTAKNSGIVLLGRDSLGIGKGMYRAIDSTINGTAVRFYRWEQNTAQAIYSVSFSPVGQGNGDYIREGIGRYVFVGLGAGQYAPIVILPAPQLHQLYSFHSTAQVLTDLTIEGEYAASDIDRNRFSSIGDTSNTGGAVNFVARYHPTKIVIGSTEIGSVDFTVSERYKQSRFLSLDRTDEIEFGRKWSTDSLLSGMVADEEMRESKFSYLPSEAIILSSGYGTLERTGQFFSERYDGSINAKIPGYPFVSYYIETISGEEKQQLRSNNWIRQKGVTEYSLQNVVPSFRFEKERRTVRDDAADSILNFSYAFVEFAPKVSVHDLFGMDASTEFEWRNDDAVDAGNLIPQSNSLTQHYSLALREIENFSASSVVTFREKSFTRAFQTNNQNHQTTLIKLQSRYRPFSQGLDIDLLYDAATQRTAKLERYFYKVRKGDGQYSWTDANENGIIDLNDEREFIQDRYDGEYIALALNSENLIPVITLKTSSRIRISPSKMIKNPGTVIGKMVTNVSTETFFRMEERSTESNITKIYFLDMDAFLNPVTTLMGYQFIQQDLFLFEYHPEYSFRFRFNQRKGLNQFASGNERNYSRERSLRSRIQLANDISNQTDIIVKDDIAVSSSQINRSRSIASIALVTDLSYRPESHIEIGLKIETSQGDDYAGPSPVTANFNGQALRFVYGFLGNGQVRSEFSREEVILQNRSVGYNPPYELTTGRDIGKNYLWNLTSEYRMGGNVQFSLHYSGRTTVTSSVVHTGRMEVRAFF
ncbi:MAG: hypothetical protein WCX28_09160 [Bacteriovoracaceae bacterium]